MSEVAGPLVVRAATSADGAAIDALEGLSASTRRSLARDLVRAEAATAGAPVLLVAVRSGATRQAGPDPAEVVGAAIGLLQHDEGHVLDLAVAPDQRRDGVGTGLLRALLDALLARGARAVTLEVGAGNLGAQALYRAEGFTVEGRRPRYYPDGDDAILMWWRPDDATRTARIDATRTARSAAASVTAGAATSGTSGGAPRHHASSTGG